jgi:hypothetical protein
MKILDAYLSAYEFPERQELRVNADPGRALPGRMSTETRVDVADPRSRKLFARHWRVVRPFSVLVRALVSRAARRRAEAAA